jgi:transglutaminase-like putative cysteine protease
MVDFFDKLLLASPTPLKNVGAAKSAVYRLERTGKTNLQIPNTDNQTVVAGKDGVIEVTVRPVAAARGEKFPYRGKDPAALEALKPTRFVQGDHAEVAELARKAIGDTTDAAEAGRRIEKFVRQYVNKKNLAVGYASAVEVARSREGDCTEHAVLVAAMCRSVGIPCQVASGLGYVSQMAGRKDVFGPHAWAQAYIGGKWVGLDAALNGFDAGHITLAAGGGDPEDFFGVTQSLGMFKIVSVELKE